MFRHTVTAFLLTVASAGRRESSRALQYCYDDYNYYYGSSGTYDYYSKTYTWADENCPDSYDSYTDTSYTCDAVTETVCQFDGLYDSYETTTAEESVYDPETGFTYNAYYGEYYDTDGAIRDAAAVGGTIVVVWILLWILIPLCSLIGTILCCLCCCGVFGKKCCWYDCYGCKKKTSTDPGIVVVQQ